MAERLAALAMGRPIEAAEHVAIDLPVEQLRRLVGRYRIDGPTGGFTIREIVLEDGRLFYAYDDDRRVPILPVSSTRFFAEGAAATLEFELDGAGRAVAFLVHAGGGQTVRAVRVR